VVWLTSTTYPPKKAPGTQTPDAQQIAEPQAYSACPVGRNMAPAAMRAIGFPCRRLTTQAHSGTKHAVHHTAPTESRHLVITNT